MKNNSVNPHCTECAPLGEKNGTHVLPAYREISNFSQNAWLMVWCHPCGDWHQHGAFPEVGRADGHRGAHCRYEDTPYKRLPEPGYYIQEIGLLTPQIKRAHRPQRFDEKRYEEARKAHLEGIRCMHQKDVF